MKKICIVFASLVLACSCSDSSTDNKEADKKSEDPAAAAPASEAKDPLVEKGMELIAKSDCLTCHKLNEQLTGPAYAAIAAKYRGQENIIDSLAHKIIKGGSGVWGPVPMTPHPDLSEEDAKTMVHYVMSIK